ncbi:crossover junction endodeoxyribonuclease RuvC [bacterium F11]|nr:crossover junction endodeoxyribonuclease RuvC [bacterium F11]
MKILGIDPGLARLGWCVLEGESGQPQKVHYGLIETEAKQSLTERLTKAFSDLKNLISHFEPDSLALETLFFVKNAKTLAQVGHIRGIILLAAGQEKIEVSEYAPRQIKLSLTGFGGAEKKQMQLMVQRMLGLPSIPKPDDVADACAVALCHLQFATHLRKAAVTV